MRDEPTKDAAARSLLAAEARALRHGKGLIPRRVLTSPTRAVFFKSHAANNCPECGAKHASITERGAETGKLHRLDSLSKIRAVIKAG